MNENNSVNNDHGFSGIGDVYFQPEGSEKVLSFGNVFKFTVKSSSDTKTRVSRKKSNPGAALDSLNTPKATEITLENDSFKPLSWSMAMMGESSKITVASDTYTDRPAKAIFDGYFRLEHRDIDPSTFVVKKGATVIEAEKYSLNADMGFLQFIDATAANEGEAITVTYTTKQVTKTKIDSAKVSSFKGTLFIDGINDVTKARFVKTVTKANLSFNGELDFLSDDFNSITMSGTAEVGADSESPTELDLYH